VVSGAERAIRVSAAVTFLSVACIAAYLSYRNAHEVVRASCESSTTARPGEAVSYLSELAGIIDGVLTTW